MTPIQFLAWLDGYSWSIHGMPSKTQWEHILAMLHSAKDFGYLVETKEIRKRIEDEVK